MPKPDKIPRAKSNMACLLPLVEEGRRVAAALLEPGAELLSPETSLAPVAVGRLVTIPVPAGPASDMRLLQTRLAEEVALVEAELSKSQAEALLVLS
jgi:hypothetical protein